MILNRNKMILNKNKMILKENKIVLKKNKMILKKNKKILFKMKIFKIRKINYDQDQRPYTINKIFSNLMTK